LPHFTIVLNHPGALRRMLLPPDDLALGEAYVRGDFDIEGDIESAIAAGEAALAGRSKAELLLLARDLLRLPASRPGASSAGLPVRARARLLGSRHSKRRDAAAVTYHYDVSDDFYALWLDRRMVYSCAYFPTGSEDLEAAQAAKLEHICRKLRLRPGERLLDVGCGWGGLVIYAAERFGVTAVGATVSPSQAAFAQRRIAEAGLSDRCRVLLRDYRDLADEDAFDKVVSVGMFEHVGRAKLPGYFACLWRLLRPKGLLLNHGIGEGPRAGQRLLPSLLGRRSFVQTHVFPDGELVPLSVTLAAAEASGFEARDIEDLREHYAQTLRHWVRRLEARHDEATRFASDGTYRTWRLYMAGSAHSFATARLGLWQVLLARPDSAGAVALPPTRADLYAR